MSLPCGEIAHCFVAVESVGIPFAYLLFAHHMRDENRRHPTTYQADSCRDYC